MRSPAEPRILHDGSATLSTGNGDALGRVRDLSVGGMFVIGVAGLPQGSDVAVTVDLQDGEPPFGARARVAWTREVPAGLDEPAGVALRFLELDRVAVRRIAKLVGAHASTTLWRRKVRVRMPGLPSALRAIARDVSDETVMVEAELPWLKLGQAAQAELSERDVRNGRLRWVGVDIGPSGTASLRLAIDVSGQGLLSETPDEAAFFARASEAASDEYVEYRVQRRPRRVWAVATGIVLGCVLGSGAMQIERHPGLVSRVMEKFSRPGQKIEVKERRPELPRGHIRAFPRMGPGSTP